MTYNNFSKSSLRHGALAALREGGCAALALSGVFVFGTLLITSGCDRSPQATNANVSDNAVAARSPSTAPAGALAANPLGIRYVNNADSGEALVSGTSTLHDWTVKSSNIKGDVEFIGQWRRDSTNTIALQSIDLTIPVATLKSTEGSGMDNTMYDALKFKTFPNITYKLIKATLKSSPTKDNPAYHFDTTGQLNIAGGAHQADLDLAVVPHDDGKLTITTNVGLKMTDFAVNPPTAMFGAIKSGDNVTVKVTWQLNVQSPAARTGK